eukprot:798334-Rhodomonas_salina.2
MAKLYQLHDLVRAQGPPACQFWRAFCLRKLPVSNNYFKGTAINFRRPTSFRLSDPFAHNFEPSRHKTSAESQLSGTPVHGVAVVDFGLYPG